MAKRPLAGSPPPTKAKKPRPSQQQGIRPGTPAGSSPPYLFSSTGIGAADSPRSRSRSVSVAPQNATTDDDDDDDDEDGGTGADDDDDDEDEDDDEEAARAARTGASGRNTSRGGDGKDEEDEQTSMARQNAETKERLRVLLANFDEQQMDRYEAYRRSGLSKSSVKKLINHVLGQPTSDTIQTVVRGFGKVFVGEIVEKARSIAKHGGSLTPADIREAYRLWQLEQEGARGGSSSNSKRKLFVK